ncbi:small multi-drug export protein [Paenibacillus yanchengensis]|uniref:Small multi-drug export protein n=1 Tax=Paenibacillus yanchengensis TaxID=2035833 RepID=A0ABW4YFN1_9BACL
MDIGSILEGVKEANLFIQLGTVFLIALIPFLEGYVAAPAGIIIGFPATMTIVVASLGNWLSVLFVVVLYDKLRQRRNRKQTVDRPNKRMERARKLFGKYGVPGVTIIGPLLFGHHIGVFIALMSGASKRYVTLWMTIGVLLWTIAAGVLAVVGIDLFSYVR